MTEPRMPERTRILRPALWSEAATATLSAESFRIYVGLTTCADDDGWTLWRPATLAAHLLPYQPVVRRERLMEKARADLVAAGLLVVHPCGCAFLRYLWRDFRVSGGNHSSAVAEYHRLHTSPDESVQVRTSPASVSASASGSETASHSVSASGSRSGPTPSGDVQRNKENDDPWHDFDGRWLSVQQALERRRFYLPPIGAKGEDGTQRDRLWAMVRENADLVARIIDEAPAHFCAGQGKFFDLVGYVFEAWNALARGGGP